MPITALPQATIHLLGSTQALTTPTSLVKELIDNALDAKATSIDILISKNSLDKLEVRDNGHGISSEDFKSLGKRGHTSKLRTFEELRFIGGVTLGFRGEALASAVELGDVSVTTKTEGEAVATKLVLKAPGGVYQQTRTSHPVGTTVSVLKFMHKLPVRKKTFEKEAPKTLVKINQLLRSYALARPSIRFNFKITDGGKDSWSYAPRPNDGIKEAVSRVIGRDASMECFERSMTSSGLQSMNAVLFDDQEISDYSSQETTSARKNFEIRAFLPKADADVSRVGAGQFFSIDSRPVSHEKGTMKKIATIFKKYLRNGLTQSSEKLKNPFICLNINCPIASYDANVEPAKDDVLFSNEIAVLDLAEHLLKSIYGELKPLPASKSIAPILDDFELLLAKEPVPIPEPPSPALDLNFLPPGSPGSSSSVFQTSSSPTKIPSTTGGSPGIEEDTEEQVGTGKQNEGFGMSRNFSDDVDHARQISRPSPKPKSDKRTAPNRDAADLNSLNPWIIAQTTAPSRHDRATSDPNHTFDESLLDNRTDLELDGSQGLFVPLNTSDDIRHLQPSVVRQYRITRRRSLDDETLVVDDSTSLQRRRRNDFVSARNIAEDALISLPPTQLPGRPSRNRAHVRPFVPPHINSGHIVAPGDKLVQTTLFGKNAQLQRPFDGDRVIPQFESGDVAWAMDFEHRKEDATRRLREERRVAQMEARHSRSSAPLPASPHKNRYNAAIASLDAGSVALTCDDTSAQLKQSFKTTLPDGDSRVYLMRRQKSLAAKKSGPGYQNIMSRTLSRAKSSKLPLEMIPDEQRLHSLVYNLRTGKENLREAIEKLGRSDKYVLRGSCTAGLSMNPEDASGLAIKIKSLVSLWMTTEGESKYEVEFNLDNLFNPKSLGG